MEFVVNTMALPQVSPEALRFSVITIPLLLHIHLSSGADTLGSFQVQYQVIQFHPTS
jgi:hypothetical protein